MKKILISTLIITLTLPLTAIQKSKIEKELIRIHDLQRNAWNEGNIEGFMAHYWKSKKMTYQSGDARLSGWDALLARYKKEYPKEKMGQLEFSDLIIHVLSEDSAYVLGKWKLKTETWTKQGLFTTILKKMEDGWKIIHDHSS
ncbi:MAG: nuclear transport factor 2 family protein [Candidatus Aminicenantes bacterium]|nr:MAG: nuclear transport factor 2 family protein [Candidatus Aminicenantes bacterium]